MKTRVAVLFGGKSVEHEVSVISGVQALLSINTDKYEVVPVYLTKKNDMYVGEGIGDIESYRNIPALLKKSTRVIMVSEEDGVHLVSFPAKKFGKNLDIPIDVAFPVVHGTNVEDGALQGYLKTIGVPFVGCDVAASAVGMDKFMTKAVLRQSNVPVLDAQTFTRAGYAHLENLCDAVESKFSYPVIVKPVNLGSSVGISIAKDRATLVQSIDDAFQYATKILVEPAIEKLREINCSVVGDDTEALASECEEPLRDDEILSYKDKYAGGGKSGGAKGMASVSRKIPADLSESQREEVRNLAVKAFQALGCNGVARIDFMIDEETDTLYFNEINTIPGSLAFYLWEPVGLSYPDLLDRMIQLAFQRTRIEQSLAFTFDTNILDSASFSGSKGSKM